MSEYWISQGRKMCSYCKCWIADNKASINFHEQGKNHKENVKKRLDELRKKGVAEAKSKEKEKSFMEQIEAAALASLKKDLSANPNSAGAYGIANERVEAVKEKLNSLPAYTEPSTSSKAPPNKPKKSKQPYKKSYRPRPASQPDGSDNAEAKHDEDGADEEEEEDDSNQCTHFFGNWYSAVNEEGYTYYWNTVTDETSWYPPETRTEDELKPPGVSDESEDSKKEAEPEETDQSTEGTETSHIHPAASRKRTAARSAYGSWEVVKDEELPDLDLPVNHYVEAPKVKAKSDEQPEDKTEEESQKAKKEKKFKEKEVSLNVKVDSGAPVTFKKRKFGANRQSRKQADDDDA